MRILGCIKSKIERTFNLFIKSVHFFEENKHFSVEINDLLLKKIYFILKKLDCVIDFSDFLFIKTLPNLTFIFSKHIELFYQLASEVNFLVEYLQSISKKYPLANLCQLFLYQKLLPFNQLIKKIVLHETVQNPSE